MKKFISSFSHQVMLLLLNLTLTVLLLPASASAAGQRVAVLPFALNAPGEMDYLVAGIRSMLGSRLAGSGSVLLVERERVDSLLRDAANGEQPVDYGALAERLGADYLITGSLTALGGSVSLDAMVFSRESGPPQRFFATAAKESEIIPAVDQLAREIGDKVLGQSAAPVASPATGPPGAAEPEATTAHPERMPIGSTGAGSSRSPLGLIKSQNLDIGLQALDAGDVNGDGRPEIVLVGANRVHIYRREENRLISMGEASTPTRYRIHYVSLIDLNKNGRAEIYVSAADAKEPRSLALEWDGQQFSELFTDAEWYLRAVRLPGEGEVLTGQMAGLDHFLSPGIFRLRLDGKGSLVKEGKIDLPAKVNLFDFTLVDVDADGTEEIVMVNQDDHLVVMSRSGRRLWISDDYYGGTTRYLGGITDLAEPGALEERLQTGEKRHYVPARIAVRDINRDGRPDIITNKNISTASRLFASYRSFPAGEIHALTWDGVGMTELWRTRKIDGYIADLQLGSAPEDAQASAGYGAGEAELLVGLVLRSGGLDILKSAESTILMYPLSDGESAAASR